MRRALWKRLIALRFRLVTRRRYRTTRLETIAGQPIVVLADVFNPKLFWSGEFLADALLGDSTVVPSGATVLDIETMARRDVRAEVLSLYRLSPHGAPPPVAG